LFLPGRLLPGTLGGGSPGDVMFIDTGLWMYAPVAPLGGGVMVMLCSRRPFSGYLLLGLLWWGSLQ
jgi:hypothetical protein